MGWSAMSVVLPWNVIYPYYPYYFEGSQDPRVCFSHKMEYLFRITNVPKEPHSRMTPSKGAPHISKVTTKPSNVLAYMTLLPHALHTAAAGSPKLRTPITWQKVSASCINHTYLRRLHCALHTVNNRSFCFRTLIDVDYSESMAPDAFYEYLSKKWVDPRIMECNSLQISDGKEFSTPLTINLQPPPTKTENHALVLTRTWRQSQLVKVYTHHRWVTTKFQVLHQKTCQSI